MSLATRSVVYIFLTRTDGAVLLSRRKGTGYGDGQWGLVAGHVEAGEGFATAAIRECREEVGIDLNPDRLLFAGVMHRPAREAGEHRLDVFFEYMLSNSDEPVNREPLRCSELAFFERHQPPEGMLDYLYSAFATCRGDEPTLIEHGLR